MKEMKITKGLTALVDDDDFDELSKHQWHSVCGGKYAARSVKIPYRKMIYMHRQIMNPPDDMYIDHINLNGLDNLKENLRLATQ